MKSRANQVMQNTQLALHALNTFANIDSWTKGCWDMFEYRDLPLIHIYSSLLCIKAALSFIVLFFVLLQK